MSNVIARHHVKVRGKEGQAMLFAHGFGCDQSVWRFLVPSFAAQHRVVTFDYIGMGGADPSAYDPMRYATLDGYASDLLDVCEALNLEDVIFVGHSVSAMIGVLAANRRPDLFGALVMVGPSPSYIDDVDYRGGFQREQIEAMLQTINSDFPAWAQAMGPAIMGNPGRPELGVELTNTFCKMDSRVALDFARTTFLSDNRSDLGRVTVPSLILQCRQDVIASEAVGSYVHRHTPGSRFELLESTGHCPHISAPEELVAAIERFLATLRKKGAA